MKAEVFYVQPTDDHIATINAEGWSCPVGLAYLEGQRGNYALAKEHGMLVSAVEIEALNAEEIWVALQNGVPRASAATIIRSMEKRRSMCVGDLIVWADGRAETCASFGFERVPPEAMGWHRLEQSAA